MFAFIDEAYESAHGAAGLYVLGGILAGDDDDEARATMRAAHGPERRRKPHLHDTDAKGALHSASVIATLRAAAVVAVGSPCRRPSACAGCA